ncbi:hypothetical protein Tco_0826771 [Tanacetum coccineum]
MKAVKENEQLKKIVDSWKDSSKNLWKLLDSGMSSTSKVGLGYEIKSNDEVLIYEEEMNRTVFNCTEEDYVGKPLYNRFSKTDNFKGVPHPLTGDYTPKPQQEIDESLYVYGKKGPQKPKTSVSDDTFSENSVTTNEKVMSEPKPTKDEPSCVTHVKTPRQPMKNQGTPKVDGKNWNEMMERELGEGYYFIKKKCFVCGSLSHLIRNCDFYEKKMAREAELKNQRVFNTGNGVAKPVWNNANRVNHANHFVPRPVPLIVVRQNVNSDRSNVNTGRANVNSVSKAFRVYNLVTKKVQVNLHVNFLEEKPNVKGVGYRWMFNIDYLTDSMNYIPVSLENQTNPHAGTSEVTNSAGTLQTPNANTSKKEEEDEDHIVVPTTLKHTAAKVKPMKSSTNSKAEELLQFRLQQVWILVDLPHGAKVIGTK